ncbi:hypothetical protein ANN_05243 [Periplaneta americana]|uniref:Uncharacterized protein n=1 Tax=Periplaneta americana TaxID=6978 RepID=A0ABQ8TCJ8_PERAM|nr:hypothetical protein ANN_05243 [Periplaneta americana]
MSLSKEKRIQVFCWWEPAVIGKWPKNSIGCIQTVHQSHTDVLANGYQNFNGGLAVDRQELKQPVLV